MVGNIIKAVGIYCLGFTSGVIYTSNKFDRNPNEIFNGWKIDVQNAGQKAVDTAKSGVENIKEESVKLAEKEKQVEAEVAAAMEGGAQ